MATVFKIADYLIWYAHKHGDTITNLKLQKLVYYAQAWHLAINNTALFNEELQAWVHGPVQYELWRKIKNSCVHGWDPISCELDEPILPEGIKEHLKEVYEVYGGFSAFELERLTHQEAPWNIARGGCSLDDHCSNIISIEDMKQFYGERLTQ